MSQFIRYAILPLFFTIYLKLGFCAPNSSKIDSLLVIYTKCQTDSQRVTILALLSQLSDCNALSIKIDYAKKGLDLASKIKWDKGLLISNALLGNIYALCTKNYLKSNEYQQIASRCALRIGDTINYAYSLVYIAKNYEALGRHDQAISFLNKSLEINANPTINMGILGDLGVIYSGIGDYRQALICYNRALKMLENDMHIRIKVDLNDTTTKVGLIINIGDIYLSMSQPDKALENYKTGYKIGKEINNKGLQFFSTMGIGKAFLYKKNYLEAIKNLELALSDSRTLKQPLYEAGILDQLANTYLATGDINKATEFAEASLKIAEVNSFNDQLPKTYTTLGKLLTLKGENKQAIDYLQKAQDLSLKSRALEDEKNAWEALSVVYDKMQQPAMALSAYRHFIALRDSVYNIDKANELVRIDLQASFGRKQLADSLKQAGQYEIRMQKQTVLTYSGFVGLLLVLLLSFFVYRNYNTQKKYNELLSKEKELNLELIKAQSSVLTDIAYTQSHEIRGPVSTLLGLVQIFNFDDPADPENKDIIEGIALVTERLDKTITEVINKENEVHSKELAGRK